MDSKRGCDSTFPDYFKLAADVGDVLACFGVSYRVESGFTQLAVELVALDRWAEDSSEPRFYGAVSDGDVWRFGYLDREEKRITHDLNSYTVPKELEEVVRILAGILTE